MTVRRVDPDEAARLQREGWTYVDVRSVGEFDAGHPPGAFNVPFQHAGERPPDAAPGDRPPMVANPDFEAVMARTFAKDARLLIGCRTGNRSFKACEVLAGLGFADAVDVRAGLDGEAAPDGTTTCAGWKARGLPIATTALPGRSWAELSRR